MVFGCQSACRFDVPEYVCKLELTQFGQVPFKLLSHDFAKVGAEKTKEKIAKQIVPICFGLSNRLHVCVCVCVCVCVEFCGFQPICQLLSIC